MADVANGDVAATIPRFLEWQGTENFRHIAPHLGCAPAAPGPELGRHKVDHRNTESMTVASETPVKARKVYEDDHIGAPRAEETRGLSDETGEVTDARENTKE